MKPALNSCHDCGAGAGDVHISGCDVERCSFCGEQLISCRHKKHDPLFARWTGFWPGWLEAKELGIDLNDLYAYDFHKIFFVKPNKGVIK